MCGRFAFYTSLPYIKKFFNIDDVSADFTPSFNVSPAQEVAAIINRRLGKFHWGLVPSWSKDLSGASKMINARVETLKVKPSFKNLLKRKRCAIIADGFYEWKKFNNFKQPYYITLTSGSPFAFAGLWDTWKNQKGEPYHSCTIITTEACKQVSQIHNRMPVILKPDAADLWLETAIEDNSRLESILHESHEEAFNIRPVSKYVNSPSNNDEKCLEKQK